MLCFVKTLRWLASSLSYRRRATVASRLSSCSSANARGRRRLWASRRRPSWAPGRRPLTFTPPDARRVPTVRSSGRDVTRAALCSRSHWSSSRVSCCNYQTGFRRRLIRVLASPARSNILGFVNLHVGESAKAWFGVQCKAILK